MSIDVFDIIIAVSLVLVDIALLVIFIIIIKDSSSKLSSSRVYEYQNVDKLEKKSTVMLSFTDCNEIIDTVINEIWGNKYLLYYRIKDIRIIPKMDNDVKELTTEILASLSNDTLTSIYKYYTKDYLIKMITRRVQLLLVEYTDKYKPNAK